MTHSQYSTGVTFRRYTGWLKKNSDIWNTVISNNPLMSKNTKEPAPKGYLVYLEVGPFFGELNIHVTGVISSHISARSTFHIFQNKCYLKHARCE